MLPFPHASWGIAYINPMQVRMVRMEGPLRTIIEFAHDHSVVVETPAKTVAQELRNAMTHVSSSHT
jgi:hypothetical protein